MIIKIKRLEDDCKAYNFTQHELQETINKLEDKLANADYQIEGRDLKIKDLEKQIEKMKCCFNCKHSRTVYEHCRTDKHEKWEIKEK